MSVRSATAEDLPAVLPLVRAYCEFYETTPSRRPTQASSRCAAP